MIILWVIIAAALGALLMWLFISPKVKKQELVNQNIIDKNLELTQTYDNLNTKVKNAENNLFKLNEEFNIQNSKYSMAKINYNNVIEDTKKITAILESEQKKAETASQEYYNINMEKVKAQLKQVEDKYNQAEEKYKEDYLNLMSELTANFQNEINSNRLELDKIKKTKQATLEAIRKEKEIKDNKEKYCLQVSENDLSDIKILERIKKDLNKPRLLSMLIWQNFYRSNMTNLCNNILGVNQITGIYKITNLITDECYIGQAISISDRWKEHAKCGLGIDTPQGNKLYAAMIEYGLWNFSWELIEKCPKEQLNEKEIYYIDLYDSKNFGYNITKGGS